MKKFFLLVAFATMQTICFAQKFDGDWKGKVVFDNPKGNTAEFIFHIIGEECSEELVRRSPAEVKEKMIEMSIAGDSITLETRNYGTYKGKIIKGKIVGDLVSDKSPRHLVLSKTGKGVINARRNYNVNKKYGIVVY